MHGVHLWNQTKQCWVDNKNQSNKGQQVRDPKISRLMQWFNLVEKRKGQETNCGTIGVRKRYKDFKGVLKATVYESLTVSEFKTRRASLIIEFNLENNDWLSSLYDERHMWKYAKVMDKRVRDETAADAKFEKYVRRIVTGFTVEKYFQTKYTDKFQEVQTECNRMMYCNCNCKENKMLDEYTIEYAVEDRVWIVPERKSEKVLTNRRRYLTATFNKVTKEVDCQCHKFVAYGIMCNHMMQILEHNLVVDIPDIYVVSRWRKDILRKHTRVGVSYHDPNKYVAMKRYNKLMAEFEELCNAAAMVNDDVVDIASNAMMHVRSQIEHCRLRKAAENISMSFPENANESGLLVSQSTNHP